MDETFNKDIVELFTDNTGRYIHFIGYGWFVGTSADGDPSHVYRFINFVHNTIPLETFVNDVQNRISDDYNEEYNASHHAYIEDCNLERLEEIYTKEYGGESLSYLTRENANSLPDGCYLWE